MTAYCGAISTALAALLLSTAAMAQAASVRLNADFDLTFDCERPVFVRNHAIRARFDVVLRSDKTASGDLALTGLFVDSTVYFDARLGGRPRPAPGGTSQLRVVARDRLQAIWDLPNNQLVLDIRAVGQSCAVSLALKLKPGQREYTIYDGKTMHYCSNQRLVRTTCRAE